MFTAALATDPSIYPEGLTTGYFGPLTKEALKRFQQRFELRISGELDEETRLHLEEVLAQRENADIRNQGVLRAPGIMMKIRDGVELRIRDRKGNSGPGSVNSNRDMFRIQVEVKATNARVDVRDGSDRMRFVVESTDENELCVLS